MLIRLDTSKLFTQAPAIRFAKEYDVDPEVWNEMWRRHKILEYSLRDLCDFFFLRVGRKPNPKSINKWIVRTNIYFLAHSVSKRGVRVVDSEFFRKFEQDVLNEMSQNMRFKGTQENKMLL